MPWILRAAIRYADPDGDWDIELRRHARAVECSANIDFDASADWGRLDVDLADIESVGLIQLKPSWRDSESLRLGGALTWDDGAVVTRGGIYYESGAQKRKMMDIGTYDPPKIGITGGIRYILANKLDLLGSGSLRMFRLATLNGWRPRSSQVRPSSMTRRPMSLLISSATAFMTQNRSLRCLHWSSLMMVTTRATSSVIMQSCWLSGSLCWHPLLGLRMRSIRMDLAITDYRKTLNQLSYA